MFCAIVQSAFFLLCKVTKVLVLETNALKEPVQTSAPHSYACSNFQAELLSKLLLIGTHLRKRAASMLSYLPASSLHPQVIYSVAFSAGLNGFQVR